MSTWCFHWFCIGFALVLHWFCTGCSPWPSTLSTCKREICLFSSCHLLQGRDIGYTYGRCSATQRSCNRAPSLALRSEDDCGCSEICLFSKLSPIAGARYDSPMAGVPLLSGLAAGRLPWHCNLRTIVDAAGFAFSLSCHLSQV